MDVAIIGFGIEGKSAYAYWSRQHAHITICDQNSDITVPDGAERHVGNDYLKNLERFDLIVRSAGVNPALILADNPGVKPKITTVINEFLRVSPTKQVIGVTGTKGKGTTSTLIAKMLEAAGEDAFLGGNIGRSPLDFLPELSEKSWVVLELSSFQLTDLAYSPPVAVCIMTVPDHLNWHTNTEDYVHSKAQLFAHQSSDDLAIYFNDNELALKIASTSPGALIPYFAKPGAYIDHDAVVIDDQDICQAYELKLLGKHNWQNICAAVTAVWKSGATHDIAAIRAVLTTFSGLEHRLEFVREVDGVTFYDDSFGTTPETAIVAIQAFDTPKVVILGGSAKGVSYDELADVVCKHTVRAIVVIGDTGPVIQAALERHGFHAIRQGGTTMPDIVAAAKAAAQPGDVVLLSPACASFGLFTDYKERGRLFHEAVSRL